MIMMRNAPNKVAPSAILGFIGKRPTWGDVTGAFGDIGTLVPIYLAMVSLNGLPPARSLILLGVVYIAAALYFRLPVPVQPLKAMAAIAIANGFGMPIIHAAAIWMGLIMLTLSWTGGIKWLSQWFSRPIVKGIQLGVGLMLMKTGFNLLFSDGYPVMSQSTGGAFLFSVPVFFTAFWLLVVPQIPLTLGNAVFAVSDTARDYFGRRAFRATPNRLATSIGIANLAAGFIGGLPVCHGSGGLTAHVRFGARTAWATIITGLLYLGLGLVFRHNSPHILSLMPLWFLAVLIFYVGLCHVWLVRNLEEKRVLALAMGLVGLASGNLAVALGVGFLLNWIYDNMPGISLRLKNRPTPDIQTYVR